MTPSPLAMPALDGSATSDRTPATGLRPQSGAVPRTVASDTLLNGQRCVQILHNGAVYQLRATKLGKLILTK